MTTPRIKTAALVIGHGPKLDKGAENRNGTTELAWNGDLARMIASELDGRLNFKLVHRVTERLQPVKETNETMADLAVELHLNSFNRLASGTEMIHSGSVGSEKLATLLQAAAIKVLKLPDRGIKLPQNGRGERWLKGTRMPAVIVESFFIDHDHDLRTGTERKLALAKAYADALVAFAALPSD